MLRKLLPILLALIGLGGGIGAGIVLRPPPVEPMTPDEHAPRTTTDHAAEVSEQEEKSAASVEYVKLNNQFVVPVVKRERVTALVIMSLSLEVRVGMTERVYAAEPKLRDGFLQVLFAHANAGGFDGTFTESRNMDVLRRALLETARKILDDGVNSILVVDIVRQDSA